MTYANEEAAVFARACPSVPAERGIESGEAFRSWEVLGRDGQRLQWAGFFTGPVRLSPSELDDVSRCLLGVDVSAVAALACQELEPFAVTPGVEPVIIVGSASTLKQSFESDLASVEDVRAPDDFATYNEARSVYLAGPQDLVLGRTAPWRQAVIAAGVDSVEVPGVEYYYLTQALLKLAVRHRSAPVPEIERIIDRLRRQPGCAVRVFALDVEAMVLLVWLRRVVGLPRLRVDANGPIVAHRWNQKSTLHPTVDEAASVAEEKDPFVMLAAESETTPLYRQLGLVIPRLPGYTVRAGGRVVVESQVNAAVAMMRRRYGLARGCLKPATGLTGTRIRTAVALESAAAVAQLVDQVSAGEEDYILEAHADYLRHHIPGYEFIIAPSMHIIAGAVGEGATLQFTRGSVWQGNVYVDERSSRELGMTGECYAFLRASMGDFLAAFQRHQDLGLVKGGIDFAVARVGGRFADTVLAGMQDLNLSSNGAEFLRGFLRNSRAAFEAAGDLPRPDVYAATKVIRPSATVDLDRLRSAVDSRTAGYFARAITSVPGRWGLIGVAGPSSGRAAADVLDCEARLFSQGLVETSLREPRLVPETKPTYERNRA